MYCTDLYWYTDIYSLYEDCQCCRLQPMLQAFAVSYSLIGLQCHCLQYICSLLANCDEKLVSKCLLRCVSEFCRVIFCSAARISEHRQSSVAQINYCTLKHWSTAALTPTCSEGRGGTTKPALITSLESACDHGQIRQQWTVCNI